MATANKDGVAMLKKHQIILNTTRSFRICVENEVFLGRWVQVPSFQGCFIELNRVLCCVHRHAVGSRGPRQERDSAHGPHPLEQRVPEPAQVDPAVALALLTAGFFFLLKSKKRFFSCHHSLS